MEKTILTLILITGLSSLAGATVSPNDNSPSGFTNPFSGDKRYERFSPIVAKNKNQINEPLGQARADEIARQLGMVKSDCFTQQQFLWFVTGVDMGKRTSNSIAAAYLVDECIFILTNTKDNPLIRPVNGQPTAVTLGSYGLTVSTNGMLESVANTNCPCRQVNELLGPGGYVSTWCTNNGASKSIEMLRKSAYTPQVPYGSVAQTQTDPYELVTNTARTNTSVVGMSMIPPIWEVNFCLIYMLNPALAANMPAYWTAIPKSIVDGINASTNGQVPVDDYAGDF